MPPAQDSDLDSNGEPMDRRSSLEFPHSVHSGSGSDEGGSISSVFIAARDRGRLLFVPRARSTNDYDFCICGDESCSLHGSESFFSWEQRIVLSLSVFSNNFFSEDHEEETPPIVVAAAPQLDLNPGPSLTVMLQDVVAKYKLTTASSSRSSSPGGDPRDCPLASKFINCSVSLSPQPMTFVFLEGWTSFSNVSLEELLAEIERKRDIKAAQPTASGNSSRPQVSVLRPHFERCRSLLCRTRLLASFLTSRRSSRA